MALPDERFPQVDTNVPIADVIHIERAASLHLTEADLKKFQNKFPTPQNVLHMFGLIASRALGEVPKDGEIHNPVIKTVESQIRTHSMHENVGLDVLTYNYNFDDFILQGKPLTPKLRFQNDLHLAVGDYLSDLEKQRETLPIKQRVLLDGLEAFIRDYGEFVPPKIIHSMEFCLAMYCDPSDEIQDLLWEHTS